VRVSQGAGGSKNQIDRKGGSWWGCRLRLRCVKVTRFEKGSARGGGFACSRQGKNTVKEGSAAFGEVTESRRGKALSEGTVA